MGNTEHPRLHIPNFLSLDLCKQRDDSSGKLRYRTRTLKELEFIHKSCGTVGYRLNVFSTTLSHLIATNCAHFIMPFVPIRERLKDKVEEFFGCEFELFVEFTGLISWTKGSSIGWHSDDNRPYLKQRDFAVVCYLNSYDQDFKGGLFHFKDADPSAIVPLAGDVVMYTADSRNIHSVDEIIDGERLTLTLWFTRDGSHDEDAKLLHFLTQTQKHPSVTEPTPSLPLPAPSKMYWFSPDQASNSDSGFDIRVARIHALSFGLYSAQGVGRAVALDLSNDSLEILMEPLKLTKEDELFEEEFTNILHVLQVVQFYYWNSEIEACDHIKKSNVVPISQSQKDNINMLRHTLLKDNELAETLFSRAKDLKCNQNLFNWASFCAAIIAWETYSGSLVKEMLTSLPYWRTHQSIFSVSPLNTENGDVFES